MYLADALELLGRSVAHGIASGSTDEAWDNNELFLGDFEAIVSTTLGIFSALELEILLVFQPRDLVSYGAFQKRMLTIE